MKTASSDEDLAFKQKERDINAQLGCKDDAENQTASGSQCCARETVTP
jgi:hypothetical protein